MIIIELLTVSQSHWSCRRWDFIEGSPKGFQYLSVNMTCPFEKHETEPRETQSLVGTEMELSNSWHHFQIIWQGQARRFFYPGQEILVPLASHIIGDKGSLYTMRVVGDCLTNWVVDIFLPLSQVKNQQIIHENIGNEFTVLPYRNQLQNGEQSNHDEHRQ